MTVGKPCLNPFLKVLMGLRRVSTLLESPPLPAPCCISLLALRFTSNTTPDRTHWLESKWTQKAPHQGLDSLPRHRRPPRPRRYTNTRNRHVPTPARTRPTCRRRSTPPFSPLAQACHRLHPARYRPTLRDYRTHTRQDLPHPLLTTWLHQRTLVRVAF